MKGTEEEEEISNKCFTETSVCSLVEFYRSLPYLPSDCCGNRSSMCA